MFKETTFIFLSFTQTHIDPAPQIIYNIWGGRQEKTIGEICNIF